MGKRWKDGELDCWIDANGHAGFANLTKKRLYPLATKDGRLEWWSSKEWDKRIKARDAATK